MNQQNSFNLVSENWIPVITLDGESRLISLTEIFERGNNYSDLAVRPHERVSLMRLLLCIAHASLDGPEDIEAWEKVPQRLHKAAKIYLDKWKDSFDLFHPKIPFLQIPDLQKVCKNETEDESDTKQSVSKLDFTLASGNNSTLYDHESNSDLIRIFPPEWIALNLITFQNYFLAGGKTTSMVWGGIEGGNKPPNPGDGPCSPSSMYHCFARGLNIVDTLHLNLVTKNSLELHYSAVSDNWWGCPVWETFPLKRTDKKAILNATETYLGRLVPVSRLIRLFETCDFMIMGEGLSYRSFNSENQFPPETTATIVLHKKDKKQEYSLLAYRPNKSPWREIAAILVKRTAGSAGGPLFLSNVIAEKSIDIHTVAMAREQASAVDFIESVYHLPSQLFEDDGRNSYENETKSAEYIARRLGFSIENYRKSYDGGWDGRVKSSGASKGDLLSKLHSIATTHYWTTVEKSLHLLFKHVESIGTTSDQVESTRKEWHKLLWFAARESYTLVCGQDTPRKMRAFAIGWQTLNQKFQSKEKNEDRNRIKEEVIE